MEQFYSLLSVYNKKLNYKLEWPLIYTEKDPPIYWSTIGKIMDKYDRSKSCFEIGSGAGDVLSLLMYLGFESVHGIEKDESLAQMANEKLAALFNQVREKLCIHDQFPTKLNFPIDILVMVNCVYWDDCHSKEDYLEQILTYYMACGEPPVFIWEVIDDVEQGDRYPEFVRLAAHDVKNVFKNFKTQKIDTYRWPNNTSSKSLYIIER